jgi:putative restriction endonuclease
MNSRSPNWTRDETLLAINLYSRLPFGQLHKGNREVIGLAEIISRTPGSVAMKLGNLASLDPAHQARGVKGLGNCSKIDREVWEEFFGKTENASFEAEIIRAGLMRVPLESLVDLSDIPFVMSGEDRDRLVKTRVNQKFFRDSVLASHNNQCCITGLGEPELLVASHIVPWKDDKVNRLNPANGLALNALHDKAFDRGLITVTEDLRVLVSSELKRHPSPSVERHFLAYEGKLITVPNKFPPDANFLRHHHQNIFRK